MGKQNRGAGVVVLMLVGQLAGEVLGRSGPAVAADHRVQSQGSLEHRSSWGGGECGSADGFSTPVDPIETGHEGGGTRAGGGAGVVRRFELAGGLEHVRSPWAAGVLTASRRILANARCSAMTHFCMKPKSPGGWENALPFLVFGRGTGLSGGPWHGVLSEERRWCGGSLGRKRDAIQCIASPCRRRGTNAINRRKRRASDGDFPALPSGKMQGHCHSVSRRAPGPR